MMQMFMIVMREREISGLQVFVSITIKMIFCAEAES